MATAVARPMVQAGFGTPAPQNRWGVAFRLILIVPQFFVFLAYSIAAGVLVFIGWFAALITGRMPESFAEFISSFIQYQTRYYSYFYLMNSAYPPYSLQPSRPYGVNLEIGVGPVRRLAVLFRIILLIPAAIVSSLAGGGLALASFFIWLIVLVAGRMPNSLFEAISAVLRFQARFGAYVTMLTSKYPGELFGDAPGSSAPSFPPAFPPAFPQPPAEPPPVQPPAAPPFAPEPVSPFETPGVAPQADWTVSVPPPPPPPPSPPSSGAPFGPPPVGPPTTGRLVLSKAGKRIVVLFLFLGLLTNAASWKVRFSLASNSTAYNALINANSTLETDIRADQTVQSLCTDSQLQCEEQYQQSVSNAFSQFGNTLRTISFPASSRDEVTTLSQDTDTLVSTLRRLGSSTDANSFNALLPHLEDQANQWDSDYSNLVSSLL